MFLGFVNSNFEAYEVEGLVVGCRVPKPGMDPEMRSLTR